MGDFGKGFVHVLTEESLELILSELDTVEDLVAYLTAKERFLQDPARSLIFEGENDLLAIYLTRGGEFPEGSDLMVVDGGIWSDFVNRREYKAKKEADRESYVWDRIIEYIAGHVLHDRLEFGADLNSNELGLRVMAKERRFARRILAKSFKEFYDLAGSSNLRARLATSLSGVVYVFLATPHGYPREDRRAELGQRCFVARGLHRESTTVVGLATEQYVSGKGFSFDLAYVHYPEWTEANQELMGKMQSELGYFRQPRVTSFSEDEYPS